MRNASGHQGENENTEQEHMHTTSTERVTRKFLEFSRYDVVVQNNDKEMYVQNFFLPLKHIVVAFSLSLSSPNLKHYTISYFALVNYKYKGELRFFFFAFFA